LTVALLVVVCLLAAIVFVQFGALVELYNQVKQIRSTLDLDDSSTPLELGSAQDLPPSSVGLPADLDDASSALVLFLSNTCGTCRSIATALRGALPSSMWIVVEPVFEEDAHAFVEQFELHGPKVVIDHDNSIASKLGLNITPVGMLVQKGRLHRAEMVSSPRQVFSMMPVAHTLP
jgi:thiol-disulfide isomerase/thioredoxin